MHCSQPNSAAAKLRAVSSAADFARCIRTTTETDTQTDDPCYQNSRFASHYIAVNNSLRNRRNFDDVTYDNSHPRTLYLVLMADKPYLTLFLPTTAIKSHLIIHVRSFVLTLHCHCIFVSCFLFHYYFCCILLPYVVNKDFH